MAEYTLGKVRTDVNQTIRKHTSMQAIRSAAKTEIEHRNPQIVFNSHAQTVIEKAKEFNTDKRKGQYKISKN